MLSKEMSSCDALTCRRRSPPARRMNPWHPAGSQGAAEQNGPAAAGGGTGSGDRRRDWERRSAEGLGAVVGGGTERQLGPRGHGLGARGLVSLTESGGGRRVTGGWIGLGT
jgi:hypothetical protein